MGLKMSIKILTKEESLLRDFNFLMHYIDGAKSAFVDNDSQYNVLDNIKYKLEIIHEELFAILEKK